MLIFSSKSDNIELTNSTSQVNSKGNKQIDTQLQSAQIHGDVSSLMYYYVDVFVGDKRMKQSLIIDTGSALTAFPCKGECTN